MSRRRDTNWSRDEITVLLESIIEITKARANEGRKTNSREVFEYAAKRMGERGHSARAEREKCRTKWKKMKEEFTHAKKARDGDTRYKEAPGIQPFFDRMEEFITGTFDNISPFSTIVRRTSSLSSRSSSSGMRASARIAATNGVSSTDTVNGDANNNNNNNGAAANEYPSTSDGQSNVTTVCSATNFAENNSNNNNNNNNNNSSNNNNNNNTITSPSTRQNSRLLSGGSNAANAPINSSTNQQQPNQARKSVGSNSKCGPTGAPTAGAAPNNNMMYNNSNAPKAHDKNNGTSSNNTNSDFSHNNNNNNTQTTEQADISYRVSTGCRQITIFGDHDVDIKFRGDCVTINKITDYQTTNGETQH